MYLFRNKKIKLSKTKGSDFLPAQVRIKPEVLASPITKRSAANAKQGVASRRAVEVCNSGRDIMWRALMITIIDERLKQFS